MPNEEEKFPGNQKMNKRIVEGDDSAPKKLKQVTKGRVIKKPVHKRSLLGRVIANENLASVGNYVVWDVLIPALKSTINDIVSNATEMIIYGESRRDNIRRDRGKSYVSYTGYYKERDRHGRRERRTPRNRSRHDFDDILIDDRGEAEEVLSILVGMIDDYGFTTVSEFYDLVGVTSDWQDRNWGWDNLSKAEVQRVRGGYIIDLPDPEHLD